jgi:sec-independent protein translocase protein TatB
MFDIAWGELVVIGVVALVVIGPKELPAVLRAVGQWTTKIRRMASEFQGQFQEAMREAEMADLKKDIDTLTDTAKGMTSNFTSQFEDPLNLKEATKWEPKGDEAMADESKSGETKPTEGGTADSATPVIKPVPAAVTPDGYVPSETAGPPADAPPVAAASEPAPAAAPEQAAPGGHPVSHEEVARGSVHS